MKRRKKLCGGIILMLLMTFMFSMTALADTVGNAGGTGQGNIGGTNVYTFSYNYNRYNDAIELTVTTKNPTPPFGNTCSHTFSSPNDKTVLNTKNPRLGNSLDNAIVTMNQAGGYNLSIADVKSKLNGLGYYDKGNGIWCYNGGYLTYVSAVKIRPLMKHTISYDANGGSGAPGNQTKTQGSSLTLSTTTPTRTGFTFQYWTASVGGIYYPGGQYVRDQDGGTVTMYANWSDQTAPSCDSFTATPDSWSSGNGSITLKATDEGSGISKVTIIRIDISDENAETEVASFDHYGSTYQITDVYTERSEGIFQYKAVITDGAGNTTTETSEKIYLDHSEPVIVMNSIPGDWTNVAPTIAPTVSDALSGVDSVIIKDDRGNVVARGESDTVYTLGSCDEGIRTWEIVATDKVGLSATTSVTTKYDITPPGMDGTEGTYVNQETVISGYCKDNLIQQKVDDKVYRSANMPNYTSGLKSVLLYKVKDGVKHGIHTETTKVTFADSNSSNEFLVFYDANGKEEEADYYELVASDHAGNVSRKKLTCQNAVLEMFHTSIDRSSYR